VYINGEKVVINIRIRASPGLSIIGKSEALSYSLNICPALPCSLRESSTCALSLVLSLRFITAYIEPDVSCGFEASRSGRVNEGTFSKQSRMGHRHNQ
jgi:hypothetical protein